MEEKMNNNVENTEQTVQTFEKKGLFSNIKLPTGQQVWSATKKVGGVLLAAGAGYLVGKTIGSSGSVESEDNDVVYIIESNDEQ